MTRVAAKAEAQQKGNPFCSPESRTSTTNIQNFVEDVYKTYSNPVDEGIAQM
jgi:hypothetical protein